MKMIKNVSAIAVVAFAVGVVPSAARGADAMVQPTYKRYASCAKMHKDYPRGIAHPNARVAKGSKYVWDYHDDNKYKYRPSLINADAYNTQSGVRDRDKDRIACEVE
jgi:hypothetical protein